MPSAIPTSGSRFARRDWFASAAALAAGATLLSDVSAQENPAANVADRGANLKIKSLRGFRVGTKAYVKIETNHGITGWGEVTGLEPTRRRGPGRVAVRAARRREPDAHRAPLAEALPLAPRHARRAVHDPHPLGHRHGPVGHHRQAVGRAGLSPARRPDARQDPHVPHAQGPEARHRRPAPLLRQPRRDRTARQVWCQTPASSVGPDGTVMFDAHCAVPPPMLIQFAAAIEPYDVLFLEESAVPGNIEVFKRLKEQITHSAWPPASATARSGT